MLTRSTLTLVDAIAEETAQLGDVVADSGLRSQVAFVRALADEVSRRHPSERSIARLHSQLGEELARLALLVPGTAPDAPQPVHEEILLVDDDRATLGAMGSLLRDLGYPFRSASGGEEALAEYERRRAGIVISDQSMGGMTGLQLCTALKQRDRHAYVILVTGLPEVRLFEGVHGGVDDFLHKPVDEQDLAERLSAAERLVRAMHVVERLIPPRAPAR
jgi:CheY-like chemotaxis protein